MNKMRLISSLPLAGIAFLLAAAPAFAQFGGAKILTVSASSKPAIVIRGGKGTLLVTLSVKPQYHINANQPNDPAYIPTILTAPSLPGIVFGPAHYPAAKLIKVSYSPKPLLVYRGQVVITIPFTVTKAARPGVAILSGSLAYQGCDANSCFPPASASVKATVLVK